MTRWINPLLCKTLFIACAAVFFIAAVPRIASSQEAEKQEELQKKLKKEAKAKKKISTVEKIAGTLPQRNASAGASLALGQVSGAGFFLGADVFIGWKLFKFLSMSIKIGVGNVQERSGVDSTLYHSEFTFPVRLAICSHLPRICPGLDFYISLIPGVGYGLLLQNDPLDAVNHAINGIAGISLESIRTYGNMDAGVRFAAFIFVDFLKDNDEDDPWLAYFIIELGIIVKWGKS
ncbi:MAG: hypothetical protein ABIJ56_08000 [Pseudomonadota bacterium]